MLSVKNLDLIRGERTLHSDLTFDLKAGQGLTLVGPNGSGKTTLLYYLAGLIESPAVMRQCEGRGETVFLPAELALYDNMSVLDNVNIFQKLVGAKDVLNQSLSYFELVALQHKRVDQLSTGQKRRVSLARLLLSPAKLWLLDEPDQGLDSGFKEKLQDLLRQHTQQGGAYIIATHARDMRTDCLMELGRSAALEDNFYAA